MANSTEPLPEEPGQLNPAPHQLPLERLTLYVVGGTFTLMTLAPHGGLPYALPQDHGTHTETKEPSARVDQLRTVYRSTSSAALATGFTSIGRWHFSTGST